MAGRRGMMDAVWAVCLIALAVLLQPGAPGHAAFAGPPSHETRTAAAETGQPCGDHAAMPDMTCCLSASCTAPAWASPALSACPKPMQRPASAAFAQSRAGGDGILLRPVLPPPRAA